MKEQIRLTEAEWTVMECLWTRGQLTGREATDLLTEKMGWNRSTTLTHLRRMEEKGAVVSDTRDGVKCFRPAVAREEAAVRETKNLLDRVYQGSLGMMVSALIKKQSLPQTEIDELYAILDGLEAEDHD